MITLTIEMDEPDQKELIQKFQSARIFWKGKGFDSALYRDGSRKSRLIITFSTKKSVDEFADIIQNDEQARAFFEPMRNAESRVLISFLERVL